MRILTLCLLLCGCAVQPSLVPHGHARCGAGYALTAVGDKFGPLECLNAP